MAKVGKRERHRENSEPLRDVDAFLFANGLTVANYFISNEGLIGFRDASGRAFDLIIDHNSLALAALDRLRELGVTQQG